MQCTQSRRLVLAVAMGITVVATEPATAQLRGDTEAVAAVERMIEALGGAELWSNSRTLELDYLGWSKSVEGRVIERAWRDLTRPDQRIELERSDGDFAIVLTAEHGWRARGDAVSDFEGDALARHRLFWPKDFYTLIRRLAVADPDLWVQQFSEDGPVVVYSDTLGELGWWEIAPDGAIERWGTLDMGEPLEYVYGPMRDFGNGLRLPAWGASLDGGWRFEYTRAALRRTAMERHLLERPG